LIALAFAERFEDGSPSFLAILAAAQGLEMLRALGIKSIAAHTWSLRDYLAHQLSSLRHAFIKAFTSTKKHLLVHKYKF
jgi:selenocysteine lyase/cysteine desulfurase